MLNDSPLHLLLSALSGLESSKSSKPYSIFEHYYKKLSSQFFRVSAVSVNFRLTIKHEKFTLIKNKVNPETKRETKSQIISILNRNDSTGVHSNVATIKDVIAYLCNSFGLNFDDFEVTMLFLQRKASQRDAFSGEIAFPGGKFEKSDFTTFETAKRETFEETNLVLCNNSPIISRYLGENNNFETTMNFKFIVFSHIFMIFDFFDEINALIKLSEAEMQTYVWVPIDLFLNLTYYKEHNYNQYFKQVKSRIKILGSPEALVEKIILNNDDKLLLYGMTMRITFDILNKTKMLVEVEESYNIKSKLLHHGFKVASKVYGFLRNTKKVYNLITISLLVLIIYYSFNKFKSFNQPKF